MPVPASDAGSAETTAPAQRRTGGEGGTAAAAAPRAEPPAERQRKPKRPSGLRATPILLTVSAVVVAGLLGWAVWDAYLIAPWTRDAAVRAYVVTEASEVAGRLVSLPVRADGFVRRGQLLMEIEPTDYQIAVANAEADVEQAQAALDNSKAQDKRRRELTTLSTSVEEKQNYATQVQTAEATLRRDLAALAQARVNLKRTRITSSVNGFVTNLDAQVGDYVTVGERVISIVNSDSFWVDAYFEETQLSDIHLGDRARLYLMGWKQPLWGHVSGISRGIEVQNAQADSAGLASVNPVFTWIRLAQRIPVRIALDQVPPDVILSAGMTATVQLNPHTGHGVSVLKAVLSGQRPDDIPPPLPEAQAVAPMMSPVPPPPAVPKGGVLTTPAGQTAP
ncbi:HlyD family secretion protein [Acetobacteraceae bacterium KSS8]|uniref:HlyD family secretion protein n=1 Tax=Endosaccharibacter trunci TaxID=2812733 RepID=A0ABT1WA42_9PROT|nr:HlyD family secretion protein [Acetobacteraceae bacterium KSS8]